MKENLLRNDEKYIFIKGQRAKSTINSSTDCDVIMSKTYYDGMNGRI